MACKSTLNDLARFLRWIIVTLTSDIRWGRQHALENRSSAKGDDMKKLLAVMTLMFLAMLVQSSVAVADTIAVGDHIIVSSALYGTIEGPFQVSTASNVPLFLTFCVEAAEIFWPGQTMIVTDISKNIITDPPSHLDPTGIYKTLQRETAYLYYHYRIGDLPGLAGHQTDPTFLNALSDAIYFYEKESYGSPHQFDATFFSGVSSAALDFAYNRVMVFNPNLLTQAGAIGAPAQSFLMTTVPEPSAILLLGSGLLCLAGYGWRRKSK
jgi:hypothetical protein